MKISAHLAELSKRQWQAPKIRFPIGRSWHHPKSVSSPCQHRNRRREKLQESKAVGWHFLLPESRLQPRFRANPTVKWRAIQKIVATCHRLFAYKRNLLRRPPIRSADCLTCHVCAYDDCDVLTFNFNLSAVDQNRLATLAVHLLRRLLIGQ